ncbi:MAG: calcium/sodium antiporter [Pseudomonadota bacterium]
MITALLAVVLGLALLLWSADVFVEGAAAAARRAGAPPLLIGMVIVGFGTSAPEMVVSVLSALQGNPGLALGNAYGSNIANIALILGATTLLHPLVVHPRVLKTELPLLTAVTLLAAFQLWDQDLSRLDAAVLLAVFVLLMSWTTWRGLTQSGPAGVVPAEVPEGLMSTGQALVRLIGGLAVLVGSSRILVWGAVEIARGFGVSDLIIGLTIVAVGTSLPELASSLAAARRGEPDIALGNVLGSNLFNTLAVVGLAGVIHPLRVPPEVLYRDCLVMGVLTLSLFVLGYGFGGRPGRITRVKGALLLSVFVGYTAFLAVTAFGAKG